MAFHERLTTSVMFSRLVTVSVFLCAFAVLPLPHLICMECEGACETECPFEEDGESSEEELAAPMSMRQRLSSRLLEAIPFLQLKNIAGRHVSPKDGRLHAVIGHQLANGLCAPLVI